ncbi:MAG: glycosyltransferase family 87 protein [Planctomycetota bacterium]
MKTLIPTALILLGLAVLVGTGVFSVGRDPEFLRQDFAWLWSAGHMLADGANAYDYDAFRPVLMSVVGEHGGNAYAYPPHLGPIALHWGVLPYDVGAWVLTIENLAFTLLLAAGVFVIVRQAVGELWYAATAAGLMLACPYAAHVTAMGQTSLLVAAALLWGWYFTYRGRPIVGGVLLAIAAIKPMFLVLPVIWLLLDRQWRAFATFTITGLLLSTPTVIIAGGPIDFAYDWAACIANYKAFFAQAPGYRHGTGLGGVLHLLGVNSPDLTLLAVPAVVALWWSQQDDAGVSSIDVLALLGLAYFLLGSAHDYDMVVLAPVIPALAIHVRHRPAWLVAACLALVAMYFPQRALRGFESPLLLQWRMPVLLGLFIGLAWLALRQGRKAVAQRDRPSTTPATALNA